VCDFVVFKGLYGDDIKNKSYNDKYRLRTIAVDECFTDGLSSSWHITISSRYRASLFEPAWKTDICSVNEVLDDAGARCMC